MFLKNLDGTWYDDSECNVNNDVVTFRIDPENHRKLARLAYESGIMTFDIGMVINLVIKKYPDDMKIKE